MTHSNRSVEASKQMRTCPACGSKDVRISALVAGAVQSTSRCSACGCALKFTWVSGVLSTVAVAAGLWAGLTSSSVSVGVIVGVLVWITVLFSPIKADATDPIAFRKNLREAVSRERDTVNDR